MADTNDTCCLRCGYDLTGLLLPRECPECGHLAAADHEERARPAREWFNSRRARFWWLRRTSRLPVGLCYGLDDSASRRTARRRVLLLVYLPALLGSLIPVAGNSVGANHNLRVWYYNQHDPQRRVLREVQEQETDRLYGFNLHLFRGGLFFKQPSYWVQVVERTPAGLSLSKPDVSDPFVIAWAITPWVLALCGFFIGWLLTTFLARRRAVRSRFAGASRSARAAASLVALVAGWGLWFCVLFIVAVGVAEAGLLPDWVVRLLAALTVMAWTAGCLFGWPRLVLLDGPRLIYPWPTRLAILLGVSGAAPLLWAALNCL